MTSVPTQPARIAPSAVDRLIVPDGPDIAFEGFGKEAFDILRRLKRRPHIEQYRKEKEGIHAHLKEPFKQYRDDLVVNVVLPNRLRLETERNVFSRILKNDFGAGGCHHHYWMSFYRPYRTRLTDIQLAHSLRPSGLRIAVFAGNQAGTVFTQAIGRISECWHTFKSLLNPLLETGSYSFAFGGAERERAHPIRPVEALPTGLISTKNVVIYRSISAEKVIRDNGDVMHAAIEAAAALWPIYQFMLCPDR